MVNEEDQNNRHSGRSKRREEISRNNKSRVGYAVCSSENSRDGACSGMSYVLTYPRLYRSFMVARQTSVESSSSDPKVS